MNERRTVFLSFTRAEVLAALLAANPTNIALRAADAKPAGAVSLTKTDSGITFSWSHDVPTG